MAAIVVTGASSGIGRAVTDLAIKKQMTVYGSVRRKQDGQRLCDELGACFRPLLFDVRNEAAIAEAAAEVRLALGGGGLLGLVNNAGIGFPGPILHQPTDEIRETLETNLLGTFLVTRAFAPLLGAEAGFSGRPGRIVNISSIAGKVGQPFAAAYVASKHGLEGFSEVLRREMRLYGIEVVIVAPAAVVTPIWDKSEERADWYAGTDYSEAFGEGVRGFVRRARQHGMPAQHVAVVVWEALTAKRPRLRYAPAAHPLIEQGLPRIAPARLVDWTLEKALGLRPMRRSRRHTARR
jgi:NAD(P)-dependent dehydrogenase (short-subunit alcohol dehydrogenase family)